MKREPIEYILPSNVVPSLSGFLTIHNKAAGMYIKLDDDLMADDNQKAETLLMLYPFGLRKTDEQFTYILTAPTEPFDFMNILKVHRFLCDRNKGPYATNIVQQYWKRYERLIDTRDEKRQQTE